MIEYRIVFSASLIEAEFDQVIFLADWWRI